MNYEEKDIQLKRKLIERMDRSDQEFQENLETIELWKILDTQSNKVLDCWLKFYGQEPSQTFVVIITYFHHQEGFIIKIGRFKILIQITKRFQKTATIHSTNFSFIKLQELYTLIHTF